MDKLISLAIVLLLYGICEILEHFHLFNFLQIILVFLMFAAFYMEFHLIWEIGLVTIMKFTF